MRASLLLRCAVAVGFSFPAAAATVCIVGCNAPQAASVAPDYQHVEQKVDALGSKVDQSVKENDDWTLRILAVAVAGSALLGYVPGKLAWIAVQRLSSKWTGKKRRGC